MNIQDFADKHLRPYNVKGSEIVPTTCPYCHGGSRKDKGTFAMNADTGTFNCKRGSCGRQGNFWQLCKDFGEDADMPDGIATRRPKAYAKPQTVVKTGVSQYLVGRGIGEGTQRVYRIGTDGQGNVVFPFYEGSEMVFVKFRPARVLEPGERKAWREKDTKPVLFGMHLCDSTKPLCIFEGEIDAMSGYEAGIPNCVSVPSGAEDLTWIETCWDWLHQFKEIRLFGDNDEPGQAMQRQIAVRLSELMIFRVEHDRKDANEMLTSDGAQSLLMAYGSAKEIAPVGLINLADVRPLDPKKIPSCTSGIKALDSSTGGFIMGDLSVWTGRRGEGKSTILGQTLLEAVDSGRRVCAYSGELQAARFQYWINLQAAGEACISEFDDKERQRTTYFIDQGILQCIREWYRGKFWLYDNMIAAGNEGASVLSVFEMAAKRYGCTVFLVDNLMTVSYGNQKDSDYYRAQSTFAGQLVEFAARHNAHVHLVAHPRKAKNDLGNDDVGGLAEITNRAANVFSVEKLSDKDRAEQGCDTVLRILKNRWEGIIDKIGLCFSHKDRRLYMPSVGNTRCYGWGSDDTELQGELPF